MKAVYKLTHITIDGIDYFEPEEKMTYDEAIEWAKIRGLRLLTRGEWCDLYDFKEEFRNSCLSKVYWTASEYFYYRRFAWYFYGDNGNIYYHNRNDLHTVRAVLVEPAGHHAY